MKQHVDCQIVLRNRNCSETRPLCILVTTIFGSQWFWKYLKLVSAIIYQIFISHQTIALQKLWKCFLFHLKGSFGSREIQMFVFRSSPLFVPASHCFRCWSKINLKVYDVINYLNKNLITQFVWYLGKEKRYDIETLSINKVLNAEYFYGKIMEKISTKS